MQSIFGKGAKIFTMAASLAALSLLFALPSFGAVLGVNQFTITNGIDDADYTVTVTVRYTNGTTETKDVAKGKQEIWKTVKCLQRIMGSYKDKQGKVQPVTALDVGAQCTDADYAITKSASGSYRFVQQ